MPQFDLPLEELQSYRPERVESADFDKFWAETLAETRSFELNPVFEAVDFNLETIDVFDVTYNGFGGQPIKAWLLLPHHREGRLPGIVEFIGYGGGRSLPLNWLPWSAAGFAHLIMDTRGQGGNWSTGDTPDISPWGDPPHVRGFLTKGILDPDQYYFRRVFMDAVRAVETIRSHPAVDEDRIAITGDSQGGGITIAAAGLDPSIPVAMPNVPWLCHYKRAATLFAADPYAELTNYLSVHRDKAEQVYHTLSYFDGVNHAVRARAEALFSTGLMDMICPPSTVYAAFNYWGNEKREIIYYEYNQHEGGQMFHKQKQINWLKERWG